MISRQQTSPIINGPELSFTQISDCAPLPSEAMHALNEIGAAYSISNTILRKANAAGAAFMSRVRSPCFVKPRRQLCEQIVQRHWSDRSALHTKDW